MIVFALRHLGGGRGLKLKSELLVSRTVDGVLKWKENYLYDVASRPEYVTTSMDFDDDKGTCG